MRILNFKKFKLLEFHQQDVLTQSKIYELKLVDSQGSHFLKVELTSYGWSLHRHIMNYEFTVIESSTNSYIPGGVMILGLDFNKKENKFYFYPFYNDTKDHKLEQTKKLTKQAYIEIIK
jgi:hypothetical protein